jgi:3-methyladenine DNA glycosylase AlkD
MQRYMKSAMPYRGVPAPALRAIVRDVFPRFVLSTFEEWRTALLELWDGAAYREERYAALELVGFRAYRRFRTLEALPLYAYLITTGAWWDLVDGVATHFVAELLRGNPVEMRQQLLAWSRSEDLWLRRTAIIAQVSFKAATDQQLLYACIEPNLTERNFFIRKAIGWALREYAKAAPEAVRAYVSSHPELSGLSRREALKHIGIDSPTPQPPPSLSQRGRGSSLLKEDSPSP